MPGADPRTIQAERCAPRALADPHNAVRVSSRLLADPTLPLEARAAAMFCLAHAQQTLGQGEASLQTLDRLLALVAPPDTPPPLQEAAWIQAVNFMMPTVRSGQTLTLLDAIMDRSLQRNDASTTIFLLHNMARLYVTQLDNPAAALPCFDQAIALSQRMGGGGRREAVMHYNRGYTLLRLGRHAQAEMALATAERMGRALQDHGLLSRIASDRGEIARTGGDFARARTLLEQAEAAQIGSGDSRGRGITLLRLAQLDLDAGDTAAALRRGRQALDIASAGRFVADIRDSLAMLELVHAATGDAATARSLRERRQAIDAGFDRQAALATLARMRARIERDLGPGAVRAPELGQVRLLRDSALLALALVSAGVAAILWRMRRRRPHPASGGKASPVPGT